MKRLLPLLASAALALGFSSCSRSDRGGGGTAFAPPDGGGNVLRLGNGDEPMELDPHLVNGVLEHNILMALCEGLTIEDPQSGKPIPGAAASWEVSADGRTYTFHLRKEAKWSNGDPVTSEDWIFSFQRMLSPKLASEYAYMLHIIEGAKAFHEGATTDFATVGVQAPDAHTLVIRLTCPTAYFLSGLTHFAWWPVNKAVVLKHGAIDARNTGWTKAGSFVGNGPFALREWTPTVKISTQRNPHYWNAAAVRLDGVEFYPIKDQGTEERMFKAGQLHKTASTAVAKRREYAKNMPHLLRKDPYLANYYYLFNTTKAPFNDPRVRRALSMAVDRAKLADFLAGGERPAGCMTVNGTGGFTSPVEIRTDPEAARRLLAEAGFPGGKGFPSFTLLYNTSQNHQDIAQIIQSQWKKELGLDCRLENQEWKVYMESRRTLAYDVCRAGWTSDYDDPMSFLDLMVSKGGNNHTGWSLPAYDALISAAACEGDTARRNELFAKAEGLLVEHQPIMPLYFINSVYLLHPRVKNWMPNLLDHHPYQHVQLEAAAAPAP